MAKLEAEERRTTYFAYWSWRGLWLGQPDLKRLIRNSEEETPAAGAIRRYRL